MADDTPALTGRNSESRHCHQVDGMNVGLLGNQVLPLVVTPAPEGPRSLASLTHWVTDHFSFMDDTLHNWGATDQVDYPDGRNMGFQMFPSCMYQPHLNVPSYRQIVPLSVGEHEIHWYFFGFEDDDEAMIRRRLKQANMFGPAGYVTAEDGEVIVRSQPTIFSNPDAEQVLEMGMGTPEPDPDKITTLITEGSIRAFYRNYREVLGL